MFDFSRGLRGIIPMLRFTFIGVLKDGDGYRRLAFYRLARFSTGGGWRGPALSPASTARLPRAPSLIETSTSSDVRSSRVRCRGRGWLREHSEGGSTLRVRLLKFRQFPSK